MTGFVVLACALFAFSAGHVSPPASLSAGDEAGPLKSISQNLYSKNPEANALYIQGLEYLGKGRPWAGGSLLNARKALELFRQAAKKDPQFSLAYLNQAKTLDLFNFSVPGGLVPEQIYRQEEKAARRAVELDDASVDAHAMLALIYQQYEYDWPGAEKEIKRVIELTPGSVASHIRYALFLGLMGRFEEAHAQVELSRALDAKSPMINRTLMQLFFWQHNDDAALAQGLEALQKEDNLPTHFYFGLVCIHKNDFDGAIKHLKIATKLGDAGSLVALAYAYAMAGDKTRLKSTLEQFNHHPARGHVPYRLAAVYVALGDKEKAIKLIEKDYRQRSNWLDWLKVDPAMDPLRQEPRFIQLMHKLKLD